MGVYYVVPYKGVYYVVPYMGVYYGSLYATSLAGEFFLFEPTDPPEIPGIAAIRDQNPDGADAIEAWINQQSLGLCPLVRQNDIGICHIVGHTSIMD